ncbi:MAG TPA: DUF4410 domain-containing protein [Thermoanaerobaculia bacterium]|nr:DUF4410 domain-containing protein [Thermoanaerobaculia bacterium]
MPRQTTHLLFALSALLLAAGPLAARGQKSLTAPGKYKDWNDDIDRVEIVQTFKLADYARVVVEPLDGSGVELPDKDDNTYGPVKAALQHATGPYALGIAAELGDRIEVVEADQGGGGEGKFLILRGTIETLDPGSQAARYWVGFGAGAAKTGIEGELFDAETGKVLVRFTQERRSGVGDFGGDYEELFDRNLRQIGGDIGTLLGAF